MKAPTDSASREWPLSWAGARGAALAAIVLFALVLIAFLPAIDNAFVGYDDPEYVTANPHVQRGLTGETIHWAFTSGEVANWHPLTWLSHALDCQLFGLQPWGHHLTSLLGHGLATVFCFLALRALTGAPGRSWVVAAFFGLHPLRVESVAWVAERKDVLSAFWFMAALWTYARYAKAAEPRAPLAARADEESAAGLPSWFWYALTLLFFVLGLMSKPMVVTLPCLLLVLDVWPLARWHRGTTAGLVREKLPLFAAAFGVSLVAFLTQQKGGAMTAALPFADRLENALVAYCRYLGKTIWPTDLAVFYPPVRDWPALSVAGAFLVLALISLLAFFLRRPAPFLPVGWCWFLGLLVPVIGLVPIGEQSMADRYSYLPSAGLFLAAVWAGSSCLRRWRLPTAVDWGVVTVLILACAALSRVQLSYWKDSETLFRRALTVTRGNYLAHNNLGTALFQQGRLAEAREQIEAALAIKPDYALAHKNLGAILDALGQPEPAISHYQEALRLNGRLAEACNGMGLALEKLGRVDDAERQYREAIRLKPNLADAYYNLGVLLQRSGHAEEAVRAFQTTLTFQPNSSDAHGNLGFLFERAGQLDAAIHHYEQAVRLRPDYARAHYNLGVALAQQGRLNEAELQFREALRLKPDYGAAQTNLSILQRLKPAR